VNVPVSLYDLTQNVTISSGTILISGLSTGQFFDVSSTGLIQVNAGGTFIAGYSGSFFDVATWIGGVIPTDDSLVIIPSNIEVTIAESSLNISVSQIRIYGVLTIGNAVAGGFTFSSSINIFVGDSGTFRDQTLDKRIYFQIDSILTFATDSIFIGSNTQVSSLPSNNNFTLGSVISSAFTVGFLGNGSIATFPSVMCIVRQSGSLTSKDSWLGLVAPDTTFCTSVGNCDVYIPTSFTLSTDTLNGDVNIPFNDFVVSSGATLQLGSSSLTTGFRFKLPINLAIYGKLQNMATGGGNIYIPFNSQFYFYGSANFETPALTALQVFNPSTNQNVGSGFILTNTTSGPLLIQVSSTGIVSIDGGSNTTTGVTQAVVYTTVQSGDLTDPETWSTGTALSDNSIIIITAGTTVTYDAASFNFYLRSILIYGTLSITSANPAGFTFNYPVNIMVASTGRLEATNSGASRINLVVGSVITFASGATYAGADASVYAYSTNVSQAVNVSTITLSTTLAGPFTKEILIDLTARSFPRVTYIVRQSGLFLDYTTWPGLLRPTSTLCPASQGCGLFVGAGLTLSTADLNGTATINFAKITVEANAVLKLGTSTSPASSAGFRFRSSLRLDCYGTIQYLARNSTNLLVPINSFINFYSGGSFSGPGSIFLASYNVNNVSNVLNRTIWTTLSGPISHNIDSTGVITNTSTVPEFVVR